MRGSIGFISTSQIWTSKQCHTAMSFLQTKNVKNSWVVKCFPGGFNKTEPLKILIFQRFDKTRHAHIIPAHVPCHLFPFFLFSFHCFMSYHSDLFKSVRNLEHIVQISSPTKAENLQRQGAKFWARILVRVSLQPEGTPSPWGPASQGWVQQPFSSLMAPPPC